MSRRRAVAAKIEEPLEPEAHTIGDPSDPCPFCKRPIVHLMKHHLVPKTFGGKVQLVCCRDCHKAIHALFPHKELKRYYHTVERLMENERFRTMIAWIAKQDPSRKVKIERPRDQQGRGKFR